MTGLTPAVEYTYTVEVHNSQGMVSTIIRVRTLDDVPEAVSGVTDMASERNVSLVWTVPGVTNGDIVGYVVMVRRSGEVEWVEVIGCGGWGNSPTTSYEVTGLVPATPYQFQVSACTSAGRE